MTGCQLDSGHKEPSSNGVKSERDRERMRERKGDEREREIEIEM